MNLFSRLISVATASIGYLEVTGSNFAVFDAETGSFASGSDVQQILAESASYLVKAETASLGKVTLIRDITGSLDAQQRLEEFSRKSNNVITCKIWT